MAGTAHLRREGAIARVVIDNPESRNGLTVSMVRLMAEHIAAAGADPAVRVIVLEGAGDHFCSGADLREAAAEVASADDDALRAHIRDHFHGVVRALAGAEKPTLAVVRGAAAGFGFDLMLHADLRLGADDAICGQVFTRIGLLPDGGSSHVLPRLVGLGRAMELMLLAERFSGRQAAEWGIFNRAVPPDELDALAADWAARLAAGPPIAYRLGRRNLRAGAAGGTLDEALDREVETQLRCLRSNDVLRGVQAFFMKQPPAFEGD